MTVVSRIDVLTADLRFRFSFGHALAERRETSNVYVRVSLDDGTVGFGEGVPREYVTGESVESAVAALSKHLCPALLGRGVSHPDEVPAAFEDALEVVVPQPGPPPLAARCALELAFLDACGRRFGRSVQSWLGPVAAGSAPVLHYDAIIPFARHVLARHAFSEADRAVVQGDAHIHVGGLAPLGKGVTEREAKAQVGGKDVDARDHGHGARLRTSAGALRCDAQTRSSQPVRSFQ
jgi:L-alanine-DL-glutamate epimerase-like enolase superfamily enzyme